MNVRQAAVQHSPDMIAKPRQPLEELLARLQGISSSAVYSMQAVMADRRLSVSCDDQSLFSEFYMMFGGAVTGPNLPSQAVSAIASDIHLDVFAKGDAEFGWFRLSGRNELPFDGLEFSYAITEKHGNFELLPVNESGWTSVAFRGSDVPMFAFRGQYCIFSLDPRWRLSIVWFLFWRLLRTRSDAIFFHASALGIFGEGTIFVGPAGGGKSTTALGLAARGHNFLSDEVAGYLPQTGELIPFRRPVGIKPGPRPSAVEKGLPPSAAGQIERDGFFRLDVDKIFQTEAPRALPLRRIVFLRGFAEKPSIERIKPGRDEIVELQPLMSSFLNASHSRRVFELSRLLATTKVYQLHPGDPDATAVYLEEVFACE